MPWFVLYVATAVIMLPLDFVFLGAIGKKLFDQNVGYVTLSSPRMAPAVLFYIIYIAGVVILVNGAAPANWQHNLIYGAVLGLVAYSTFELTNMALLKHWEWKVVAVDIAWGTVLTAIAASVGGLLGSWALARIG